MAEIFYNVAKQRIASGALVLGAATIKQLLLTVAPAGAQNPDLATVAAVLAVATTAEAAGAGYVRKTVTPSVSLDNANDRSNVDHATITYAGLNAGTIVAALYYQDMGGADSGNIPISLHTFAGLPTNGGNVDITAPTNWVRVN